VTAPPPPPEPPRPPQPDMDAVRSQYKSLLEREIGKHKQYPRIAQMRGWQGEALVELVIDEGGRLASVRIQTSSGHDVLDKQALEMVRKTVAASPPPDTLRGSSSTFLVPVSFKLEN
jgi:protein TonB